MGSKRRATLSCLWPERAHNVGMMSLSLDLHHHRCAQALSRSVRAPPCCTHAVWTPSSHLSHLEIPDWTRHNPRSLGGCRGGSRPVPFTIHRHPAFTLDVWVLQQMPLQTLQDFLDLAPGHTAVTHSLRSTVAVFLWPSPTQKYLHIFAYVRQRSSPIQESAEQILGSPWTCFRATVAEAALTQLGTLGKLRSFQLWWRTGSLAGFLLCLQKKCCHADDWSLLRSLLEGDLAPCAQVF